MRKAMGSRLDLKPLLIGTDLGIGPAGTSRASTICGGAFRRRPFVGPAGCAPLEAGATIGRLASGPGARFVTLVMLLTITAGRNDGAIGDRQPQYLSSCPRHRLRSSSSASLTTAPGGAAVVE